MSGDECKHGLDPATCSICLHGVSRPAPPPTVLAVFRARYDGQCGECNLPISPGQWVAHLSNDRNIHKVCAS